MLTILAFLIGAVVGAYLFDQYARMVDRKLGYYFGVVTLREAEVVQHYRETGLWTLRHHLGINVVDHCQPNPANSATER